MSLVDDPVKGIEFCNKHIQIIEDRLKRVQEDDLLIAKYEGHLVKWTELLEKYIHQAWQQGRMKKDVTQIVSQKRFHGEKE